MVSKNLSFCPSVTNFDPNYLRTRAAIFFQQSMGTQNGNCIKDYNKLLVMVEKIGLCL